MFIDQPLHRFPHISFSMSVEAFLENRVGRFIKANPAASGFSRLKSYRPVRLHRTEPVPIYVAWLMAGRSTGAL